MHVLASLCALPSWPRFAPRASSPLTVHSPPTPPPCPSLSATPHPQKAFARRLDDFIKGNKFPDVLPKPRRVFEVTTTVTAVDTTTPDYELFKSIPAADLALQQKRAAAGAGGDSTPKAAAPALFKWDD